MSLRPSSRRNFDSTENVYLTARTAGTSADVISRPLTRPALYLDTTDGTISMLHFATLIRELDTIVGSTNLSTGDFISIRADGRSSRLIKHRSEVFFTLAFPHPEALLFLP